MASERKKVILKRFVEAGKDPKIIATITLEGQEIHIENGETLKENLNNGLIVNKGTSEQKFVKPEDGEIFLTAVLETFQSPYLFAEEDDG